MIADDQFRKSCASQGILREKLEDQSKIERICRRGTRWVWTHCYRLAHSDSSGKLSRYGISGIVGVTMNRQQEAAHNRACVQQLSPRWRPMTGVWPVKVSGLGWRPSSLRESWLWLLCLAIFTVTLTDSKNCSRETIKHVETVHREVQMVSTLSIGLFCSSRLWQAFLDPSTKKNTGLVVFLNSFYMALYLSNKVREAVLNRQIKYVFQGVVRPYARPDSQLLKYGYTSEIINSKLKRVD